VGTVSVRSPVSHDRPSPTLQLLNAQDAEVSQRRAAGALAERGLEAGDRVAFIIETSADLLCAVLGAARTGRVPVLLNPALLEHERAALVADCGARHVVESPAALAALVDGPPTELAPHPLVRPMHYTSGTTGRPKGVTAGPWDADDARAVVDDEAAVWGFAPDDVLLMCSPLHHTVSVRLSATALLRGGSVVLCSHFDPATVLKALRAIAPTCAFMVPTHLRRLLSAPELGESERWSSLRLLVHAGEACPPALKRAAMARVADGALWEFYGSTEGQFTVCPPDDWLEHPGTVGRARPGRRLEIGGPSEPAAPGEVGPIWCHAPGFARFSYFGHPGATDAAWRRDAFTVGDLGHLDKEGYLYLSGRRDDLVISGGVNVYPAEVEAVLAEVDGVREVAVFGLADDEWGQRVCAAVVGDGLTEVALRRVARDRLAPHKRPKQYVLAEDLPHTATGKLQRGAVPAHLGLAGPAGGAPA
jgi:acyl-CoA synthetase (AMP-forming)/AMP-acid ligase II